MKSSNNSIFDKAKTISGLNAEGKLYTEKNEMAQNTTLKLKPQLTTTTNVKQIADSYSNKTNSEIKSLSD